MQEESALSSPNPPTSPPACETATGRDSLKCTPGGVLAERSLNRQNSQSIPVEFSLTQLVEEGQGSAVSFRDINARKELERQLIHAQKMEAVGQLAGGVAHDFNNLLAIIAGNSYMLDGSEGLSEEMRDSVKEIIAATERATLLTRQLLSFSRSQPFNPTSLKLNELVAGSMKLLKRMIEERVQVQVKLAEGDPVIFADPGMLNQVLMNLAINARDAMPKGGTLDVSVSETQLSGETRGGSARYGAFARIAMTDTGTGIDPSNLPRIFEPFFTTKARSEGTGLGLSTADSIVTRHQGWIEVQSDPGRETTFSIYLPVDETPAPLPQAAKPPKVEGSPAILLVEDDSSLRAVTTRMLKKSGYEVVEAADGESALAGWRRHRGRFAAVLTDVVMPGSCTGPELAVKLRGDKPGLPIIFLSGYQTEHIAPSGLTAERTAFLQKPYNSAILLKTLQTLLPAG